MYTKEQIEKAFKEWEIRFKENPDNFVKIEKQILDLDEVARIKAEYFIGLIESDKS